jgi:hypothetical protein
MDNEYNDNEKRTSRLCHSVCCEKEIMSSHLLIFLFFLGIITGFIYDYILLIYKTVYGVFPTLCINGIHVHHLYIGLIIFIISIPFYFLVPKKYRVIISFIIGLGIGLIISDLGTHIIFDPFECYC